MITSCDQLFFIFKIKLFYKLSKVFQQILTSERDFSFEADFS